jgi:NAD(P)-dependent dehydrogenase (short-subunit alcohol dehydrogenase family)
VPDVARRLAEDLGGVGLLVNNAGVLEQREVPFAEDDVADVWRVVETNLRGPLVITHALLPGMLARGGGRIVNMNSGFGHRPAVVYTGYSVSKGALSRFTANLDAQYNDQGLRVFDLAPGVVPTDMSTGMPMHEGRTEWTPLEASLDLLLAIGSGELDRLSGRFLRAGHDTAAELVARTNEILVADARRLRLVTYGSADPLQE